MIKSRSTSNAQHQMGKEQKCAMKGNTCEKFSGKTLDGR